MTTLTEKMAWEQLHRGLNYLTKRCAGELYKEVALRPTIGPEQYAKMYESLLHKYGDAAVASALHAIDVVATEWDEAVEVIPAPPLDPDMLAGSVGWAFATSDSVEKVTAKLVGSSGRYVRNQSRQTIAATAQRNSLGYARVPGPKACAFCLMLASRGAVYSADTVGAEVKGQLFSEAQRYHDHCDCQARLVRPGEDLPEINQQLQDEWNAVMRGAPGNVDKAELWRAHVRLTRPNGERDLPEGVDLSKAPARALKELEARRASAGGGGKPPTPTEPPTGGGDQSEPNDEEPRKTFGPSAGARAWPDPIDEEGKSFAMSAMEHWLPDHAVRIEPINLRGKAEGTTHKEVKGRSALVSADRLRARLRSTNNVAAYWAAGRNEALERIGQEGNTSEDRRKLVSEARIIRKLLEFGASEVISLREIPELGKTPDVLVDGVMVEMKRLRKCRSRSLYSRLNDALDQSRVVYLDASRWPLEGVDKLRKALSVFGAKHSGEFDLVMVEGPANQLYYLNQRKESR